MAEDKLNNEEANVEQADEQATVTPETQGEEQSDQNEPEKKYSDAEVDGIINKKFAKWKAQQEKAIADAKEEAEKLAQMNAAQKKDYEMEKLQAENERLKTEALRSELGRTATALLKEQNIDATQDMLDFVVGDDADKTKANIEKFVGIIQSQIKAAEVARATGTTPKNYGGSDGTGKTKEEIMKIKNTKERQAAIAENIELFK